MTKNSVFTHPSPFCYSCPLTGKAGTCLKPPTMQSVGSECTIGHLYNRLDYYGWQEQNRTSQLYVVAY